MTNLLSKHLFRHYDKTGDASVFVEIRKRHHESLVEFIYSYYTRDRTKAERIADNALDIARDKYREYDETKSFSDWLKKIAGKVAVTCYDLVKRQELDGTIRALNALPSQEYRAVIYLYYVNLAEVDAAELL